jgi:hypothetical protein
VAELADSTLTSTLYWALAVKTVMLVVTPMSSTDMVPGLLMYTTKHWPDFKDKSFPAPVILARLLW